MPSTRETAASAMDGYFDALTPLYREQMFPAPAVELYRIADRYAAECSRRIAEDTGLLRQGASSFRLDDAFDRLGVVAGARPLLTRAVQILCEYGMGEYRADGAVSLEPRPRLFDPAALRADALGVEPKMLPAFEILDKLGEQAAAFASGAVTAMQVRSKVHVDFFITCPIGRQCSQLGGEAIRHIIATEPLPEWAVLELGGGTMSGALSTLEALAGAGLTGRVRRYHFTEINPFFVMRARGVLPAKFPGVGAYRFSVLDFNHPFDGLDDASFDLIHGVNCLQCAVDLPATLAEVWRVLRPGGWLLIPQYTRGDDETPLPLVDLVCEPLESYWNVALIPGIRPVHGMPTADTWRLLLTAAGFAPPTCFPDPASGLEWFDDKYFVGVIVARKP